MDLREIGGPDRPFFSNDLHPKMGECSDWPERSSPERCRCDDAFPPGL